MHDTLVVVITTGGRLCVPHWHWQRAQTVLLRFRWAGNCFRACVVAAAASATVSAQRNPISIDCAYVVRSICIYATSSPIDHPTFPRSSGARTQSFLLHLHCYDYYHYYITNMNLFLISFLFFFLTSVRNFFSFSAGIEST